MRCTGVDLWGSLFPISANGKLRSAIGKANLLISQKFRQFQDLCQQHKVFITCIILFHTSQSFNALEKERF